MTKKMTTGAAEGEEVDCQEATKTKKMPGGFQGFRESREAGWQRFGSRNVEDATCTKPKRIGLTEALL